MLYRLLADLVLLVHAAFIVFVVVGQLVVVVGLAARWGWARNFWFRAAHLAAIGVVVVQAWAGIACPLTVLENSLRELAGEPEYPSSFIAYWLHEIIFYQAEPWVFTLCYTVFGLVVLACFVIGPPRRPSPRSAPRPPRADGLPAVPDAATMTGYAGHQAAGNLHQP